MASIRAVIVEGLASRSLAEESGKRR